MLHDSILFSPGVDDGCASRILDKLKRCASKYFGSWFEYVKYRETFKRCQCERLFQYLMEIGKAIKKIRKITFRYRKNGKLSDRVYTVTPYFLVISGGWYYLICNTDGKDNLSHYRIDRMLQVVALEIREMFGKNNCYRIGGDEFLAYVTDRQDPAVRKCVKDFVSIVGSAGYSVAVGVATESAGGIDVGALCRKAEKRMYLDKEEHYRVLREQQGR